VYAFTLLGLFILLISGLNVINLTVAQLTERMREAGVRKALGASGKHLILQFMSESVLLALGGAVLGFVGAAILMPGFNELAGAQLTTTLLLQPQVVLLFFGFSVSIGVLAGLYPALLFAQSSVTRALRGSLPSRTPRRSGYRGLVMLQFGLATALMTCTAVVYLQLQHVQDVDLGFDSAETLIVDYQGVGEVNRSLDAIKEALLQHPTIQGISASRLVPGEHVRRTSVNIQHQYAESDVRQVVDYRVDYAFITQYGLTLSGGRLFDVQRRTDAVNAIIVNETMAQMLGRGDARAALGETIEIYEIDGPTGSTGIVEVIGIVRDFHVTSMHDVVEPLMLRIDPEAYRFLSVRIGVGGARHAMPEVKRVFAQVVPDLALTHRFLDDQFDAQYQSDVRFGRTFAASATLALFLACLGLNGITASVTLRRRREVGIRKTFGASPSGLIALLSRDLLLSVAVGLFAALPVAYVIMRQWLAEFAYRINLGPELFATVAVSALVIAGLTLSYQTARAALVDPVRALGHRM
ncbi:MAG: FtsX-like permease family protein, partial [Bacteroidota bacterium]